jgi:hypothetical protein
VGLETSPGVYSTWASAGLGVDLGAEVGWDRGGGLRERAYFHAVSRQVISQEIAELEAAHQRDTINPPLWLDWART